MRRLSSAIIVSVMVSAALLALWPAAPALAHALPVSYSPAPNQVLHAPITQVQIRFSEQLNPDISRIVVVNPSNQRVDDGDVQISSDQLTMSVSVPVLPAGTYVVAWRSHSADDGHVAGGSYIFYVARADGTVPPLSGPLPSGNIIGGGGAATGSFDGLTLLQTIAHWIALAALTLLLGGIFWWTFVLPRQSALPSDFAKAIASAIGSSADLALETTIGATIIEISLQAAVLDGTARGLISWPIISGILFHSRQGAFLLARMGLAALGLVCLWVPQLRGSLTTRNLRRVVPVFGVLLAVAFVYSGHGGASQQWWGAPIDLLHLLAESVWLGGLGVLALLVIPTLSKRPEAERQRYLASALPAFSIPALVAVGAIIITGPLNASTRMTLPQLWTTPYGIVLLVKIALFIVMMAISYIHAFRLRPRLAGLLGMAPAVPADANSSSSPLAWLRRQILALEAGTLAPNGPALAVAAAPTADAAPAGASQEAGRISEMMQRLFQWEATIGLGVLLCASLLSSLAGTLAPTVISNSFGASGGSQTYTQKADGLAVTLSISPGRFGSNTVTVTVKNPDGTPAQGTVFILTEMVEMDMGINNFDLQPGSQPGTFTGTVDLPMAGHWKLTTVIRTKADPQHLHRVTFTVSAAF